jgi:hypothetical protein
MSGISAKARGSFGLYSMEMSSAGVMVGHLGQRLQVSSHIRA